MPQPTLRITGLSPLFLLLSACGTVSGLQDGAPHNPQDVSHVADAVPRAEPPSKYGNPAFYDVNGKRYFTRKSSAGYYEQGTASWYGTKFHGRRTSSGEPYDMYAMTAAHKTLPLPTYAEVKNLENGRRVVVRINDRGPFHDDRLIDLSYAAAAKLGMLGAGTARVEVRAIDPGRPQTTTAQTPQPDNGLFVQVGAYLNRDNAERMRTRLADASIPGNILVYQGTGQDIYRVRIGPVAGAGDARRLTERLVSLGIHESTIITE